MGSKIKNRKLHWKIFILLWVCALSGCIFYGNKINKREGNIKNIDTYYPKTNQVYYKEKQVAITFDDGPSGAYTEKLLDGLKERNIKASFFVVGENIEGNEKIIERMYNEGHLIGNHTYTHVNLNGMTFSKACNEIQMTNQAVFNITGYAIRYIRPPFGAWTDKLKQETDMAIVMWNVDPLDWRDQNSTLVTKRILENVKDGDIILLHDIFKTSVDAAFSVIDTLKTDGYNFVRVDELVKSEKVFLRDGN